MRVSVSSTSVTRPCSRGEAEGSMAQLHFTLVVVFTSALFTCLYRPNHDTTPVRSGLASARQNEITAHERVVYPAIPQKISEGSTGIRPENFRGFYRAPECTAGPEGWFDCAKDGPLSRTEGEERGCSYAPLPDAAGLPCCFYPTFYPGYKMGPLTPTPRGQAAALTRATASYLPRDIPTLRLEVVEETAGCLHLTLKDPSSRRYEVKLPAVVPQSRADSHDALYTMEYQPDPFGFVLQRKSSGNVIMNTTVAPLLFANQYLQLSTTLASAFVSGLEEHYTSLLLNLNWTSLTLWNRDTAPHGSLLQWLWTL